MNKNIPIPISGPSANEIPRLKPFKFKAFFEIIRNQKILNAQRVNRTLNCNFCFHFSGFVLIFITLLLFTVFRNQDKMEIDEDVETKVFLGYRSICQFEKASANSGDVKFSPTYSVNEILRPNCASETSRKKPDKIRSEKESVEQQAPGSDPSRRPFFPTNDINAADFSCKQCWSSVKKYQNGKFLKSQIFKIPN